MGQGPAALPDHIRVVVVSARSRRVSCTSGAGPFGFRFIERVPALIRVAVVFPSAAGHSSSASWTKSVVWQSWRWIWVCVTRSYSDLRVSQAIRINQCRHAIVVRRKAIKAGSHQVVSQTPGHHFARSKWLVRKDAFRLG